MTAVSSIGKRLVIAQLAVFASVGCQTSDNDVDSIAVEDNDLGISRIEIEHSTPNGERKLTVRGLDVNDEEVGVVSVRTGMVLYTSEPGLIEPTWSVGTELTAHVGTGRYYRLAPDLLAHEERLPDEAPLASFVRMNAVATAIQNEVGIWFSQPRSSTETAYSATTCDPYRFPIDPGAQNQCCQDGNITWGKIASSGLLAHREYGTPCTLLNGSAVCGADIGITCAYGPAGARNLNDIGTANDSNAVVFYPTSSSTVCGRDSNGSFAGGSTEAPEAYNGTQTLYGSSGATNPYNRCCYNSTPGYERSEPQVWTTCKQNGGEFCLQDSDCDSGDCGEDFACRFLL